MSEPTESYQPEELKLTAAPPNIYAEVKSVTLAIRVKALRIDSDGVVRITPPLMLDGKICA